MTWWVLLLLYPQAQMPELPALNPYSSASDIAQGKRLYNGRCASCHGPAGEGGKGANLAVPSLARATDDRALFRIIRSGIPDTEMPGSLMDTHEIWQTAAFVRTLGQVESSKPKGNPASGAKLFRGKGGCAGCHAVGNEGGGVGPTLSAVGLRRSVAHLRGKLIDPSKDIPENYRMVQATLKSGKSISGVRLNEDTYSIQIRDVSGGLYSFWKDELNHIVEEKKTVMPAYAGRLTDAELDDVAAYLSTLRGLQ